MTENLRTLPDLAFKSCNRRSNALYSSGVLSATETSQNPILCEAANEAPSDSVIYPKQRKESQIINLFNIHCVIYN